MTKRIPPAAWAGLLLVPLAAPAAARDVLSLSLEELAQLPVTAAAGYAQPQAETPASAIVIQAAQWEALGAHSVYDALTLVPGLLVTEDGRAERLVVARGLLTSSNSQVLWLLDGMPLNEPGTGGPPTTFNKGLAGLTRIEVIRGPASVIHGSSAFSAVINLVTEEAGTAGSEVGVTAGSFDTREARAASGGRSGDWRWRLSLERRAKEGDPGRLVRRDVQTTLDERFGTAVSRAPGPLPADDEVEEALLNLGWRSTTLQYWHWQNQADSRLAGRGALDPTARGEGRIDHVALNQSGELPALDTRWELEGLYQRQDIYLRSNSLPPGTTVPIGADGDLDFVAGTPLTFPEGFLSTLRSRYERQRIGLNLFSDHWPGHTLRLSLGQEWQQVQDVESRRNFGPGVIDASAPVVPLSPLPNLAGTPLTLLPGDRRHLTFVALQDDWRLHETLHLNLGVRHDRYSDFGASTNPRASLQWQATPATRLRLGYARAFRAPSFNEQNLQNNPALLGNPALKAEKLESSELELEQTLAPGLQVRLIGFHYEARGLVDYAPRPPQVGLFAQNIEGRDGRGGTAELNWQPHPGTRLNASLTHWDIRDTTTDTRAAFVPGEMAMVNGWWEFAPRWTLGAVVRHVGDRPREPGDARPAIADNTWADLHLQTTALAPGLTLGLTVQNLADADLRDPTRDNPALGPFTPDDLPLAGRRVLLQARYRWGARPDTSEPRPASPSATLPADALPPPAPADEARP